MYRSGGRRETRREGLDSGGGPRFSFVGRSHNQKLGPIAASMTSGETCPISCELRDAGCFGEFGLLKMHWADVSTKGIELGEFLDKVAELPQGALWRHNVVGDLVGRGDRLDPDALQLLAYANEGKRAIVYTHKPLTSESWTALYEARLMGLTVNVSCNGLQHLDELTECDLVGPSALPAVVVLPEDSPPSLVSPGGVRVVVCPAETRDDMTCSKCGICARAERPYAVGFRAHGQWKAKVSELVQLRVKGKGKGKDEQADRLEGAGR